MAKLNKKLTILLLIVSLGLAVSGCFKKPVEPVNQNQNTSTNQAGEIDTSDWKTYRNEEYGFEFKYPEGWEVKINSDEQKITIFYPEWRDGLPEGGSVMTVKITNTNLNQFIDDYNRSDMLNGTPLSQIIKEEGYIIGGFAATKLTGSTAIGVDRNFLFIDHNNKVYIISFADFDQEHIRILSTIRFIK